ncbi:uncharacterized [Tachysurus ichikawai]
MPLQLRSSHTNCAGAAEAINDSRNVFCKPAHFSLMTGSPRCAEGSDDILLSESYAVITGAMSQIRERLERAKRQLHSR